MTEGSGGKEKKWADEMEVEEEHEEAGKRKVRRCIVLEARVMFVVVVLGGEF